MRQSLRKMAAGSDSGHGRAATPSEMHPPLAQHSPCLSLTQPVTKVFLPIRSNSHRKCCPTASSQRIYKALQIATWSGNLSASLLDRSCCKALGASHVLRSRCVSNATHSGRQSSQSGCLLAARTLLSLTRYVPKVPTPSPVADEESGPSPSRLKNPLSAGGAAARHP